MSSKKFLKIVFISIFIIISFIGIVNYIVDPLWLFNHSNKLNQKQGSYDERQLKTNYLYFKIKGNFDGILLGSSRATYVNQNDFENMNIFNYSAGAMMPFEYKGFIDFAKKLKGEDLKYIIIGSDFFGTNEIDEKSRLSPEYYINNVLNNSRYKFLFSIDTFKKSINNIRYSLKGREMYYDREAIKYRNKISEEEVLKNYSNSIKEQVKILSYPNYKYNENYINILKTIKNENSNTKFIIYTSAVTSDLLVSIIKNGKRWDEYKRWLYELIEVFGEVNHFMTINSITKNLENYFDDNHAYPSTLKLIANKLAKVENKDFPEDFEILLTKDNVDKYLENFKEQIEKYNLSDNLKN
ncbi:hypothetical protein ACNSOO_05035 [Aliarcobacter lanthieri]|uniref:hypothetical protein n=1 Tax=Aliarcobacter lanthieri TaxID=1355374 RepID=UPI003AAAA9A3